MSKRNKTKKRTTLFFEYSRVTFLILLITMLALCAVFVLFVSNYWTSNNADILRRNVESLVRDTQAMDVKGALEDRTSNAYLTLFIDYHTISDATGGDFFMTDGMGNVVICRDLIDDDLHPVYTSARHCTMHGSIKISNDILSKTTTDGYYTVDNLTDFGSGLKIIVGQRITDKDGAVLGYVYGTLPVAKGLNQYLENLLRMFAGAAAVSLVFAVLLVYLFSYNLTKPLREMSRVMKLYARGDFSERIPVKGNDELTDLCEQLDRMAESLEVLDESRSAFVANVSHELKTPMTTIGGFIDGILDGTIPHEEETKYLRIVSDEVKRLSSLVQTMLTLSKIEAGEEKLRPTDTELKNLLFLALLIFEKQIEENRIEICGFEEMHDCVVMADEKMIYQVIYNLYDNAVKFTNPGGMIRVALLEESDTVTVTISNTGEGIEDPDLRHIFERFYKVDKSRSEYVKGVGLGLNLAKKIVELHGGVISATSTPGELTSFSFKIPKKQQ